MKTEFAAIQDEDFPAFQRSHAWPARVKCLLRKAETDAPIKFEAEEFETLEQARPDIVPPKERYFNHNIQGARGLFALMIFIFHVHNSKLPAPALFDDGIGGFILLTWQFGVELFFCISGFVIAGTLRRAKTPLSFIEDRAIRIFPVLWAAMPVVLVFEYVAGFPAVRAAPSPIFFLNLLANLFCVPTVFPVPLFHFAAWSLSYEMAFYSICALGWALRRKGYAPWLAGLAGATMLFFHPRSAFFLVGLAVAEGTAERWCPKFLTRVPLLCLAVCLGAWGGVWVLNNNTMDTTAFDWWSDFRLPLAVLAVLAALPFFQGLSEGRGSLGLLLRLKAMQWMGKISYSFYLWQFLIMAAVKQVMHHTGMVESAGFLSQPLFFMLALPPSLVISGISQNLLEKRLSAKFRSWSRHPLGWTIRKS